MKSSPGHQIRHPVIAVLVKLAIHDLVEIEHLKVEGIVLIILDILQSTHLYICI